MNSNRRTVTATSLDEAGLGVGASEGDRVHVGDLLLSGNDTVILFYQTFPTGYRYTPLARINDPTNVPAAVGPGPIEVPIALRPE